MTRAWLRIALIMLPISCAPRTASSAPPAAPSFSTAAGAWTEIPPPRGRYSHAAIYDPARDRMIVFGGAGLYLNFNETWELSLAGTPAWTALSATGPPPSARAGSSAVYDPVRDRMIVFGGAGLADVWSLAFAGGPAWTPLAPSGSPPAGRSGHSAIYDPVRDRMLVFGGSAGGGYFNDVWALDFSGSPAWSQITPAGAPPVARSEHEAIYDPVRDRMLVFGGLGSGGDRNDAWVLDLAGGGTWSALAPSGAPPAARHAHAGAYDAAGDRMLVFGGSGSSLFNDAWALNLSGGPAWSPLAPSGTPPPARSRHTAILDPGRSRLLVFGGTNAPGDNGVWSLALSPAAWTQPVAAATLPLIRDGASAAYDPFRRRMILYGGSGAYTDVSSLSLTGAPSWTSLTPSGAPPGRAYHTSIYDWKRDRMIVFGGNSSGAVRLNDVWALDLSAAPAWSPITPLGTPPAARANHTAIFDYLRDRMIVFGGTSSSANLNDVWQLTLGDTAAWTQLSPAGPLPFVVSDHTAIFDPVGDRMVVFGGSGMDSLWTLNLSGNPRWTRLTPPGPRPHGRFAHTAFFDPGRSRMIVYGGGYFGFPDYNFLGDVWTLNLSGSPVWTEQHPEGTIPPARLNHSAVYDPASDRVAIFGGESYGTIFVNDTWTLDFGAPPLAVAEPAPRDGSLAPPVPNPARGALSVSFVLGKSSFVRLEVIDVAGRRVARLAEGAFGPGRHERAWRGMGERGERAPSGIYFFRLETPEGVSVRRSVFIRE